MLIILAAQAAMVVAMFAVAASLDVWNWTNSTTTIGLVCLGVGVMVETIIVIVAGQLGYKPYFQPDPPSVWATVKPRLIFFFTLSAGLEAFRQWQETHNAYTWVVGGLAVVYTAFLWIQVMSYGGGSWSFVRNSGKGKRADQKDGQSKLIDSR